MKPTHRYNPKVMAHRIGDPIPDWVMDLVTARQLILRKPEHPQGDVDVIFELPNLVTSDVIDVPMKGMVGDYFVFDGLEYKIVPGNEFEMLYDAIEEEKGNTTEKDVSAEGSREDDTPVMMGVGVITREEMAKKLNEECREAILIGNAANRGMFFPAIIGIDHSSGRVVYDRDLIVQQLYRHGNMTMDEADEYVSYNIERSLEAMANDENRKHMPLIVERQECF